MKFGSSSPSHIYLYQLPLPHNFISALRPCIILEQNKKYNYRMVKVIIKGIQMVLYMNLFID